MTGPLGILVGYDGSQGSQSALAWAAEEAALRRRPLTILHIWQVVYPGFVALPLESIKDAAERLTGKAVRKARALQPGIEVDKIVECGSASSLLVEHARQADVLIVGRDPGHPLGPGALGSVSAQAITHAPGLVTAVREPDIPPEAQPGRIVVGVDGSATARLALRAAFEEARLRRLPLTAVCALPPEARVRDVPFLGDQDLPQVCRERFEHEVSAIGADHPQVEATPVLKTGDPTACLLGAAADARLLVVGSRGMGAIRSLLLGSVSQAIAHRAPCPITIVHPPEQPE